MYRMLMCFCFFGIITVLAACSGSKDDSGKKQVVTPKAESVHDAAVNQPSADVGFVGVVKRYTLPVFPSASIGQAFSNYSYFMKQEWKETRTENNATYVDCIGWLDVKKLDAAAIKNDVTMQGVGFKFLITKDGSLGLVMVTKVDVKKDGKFYISPIEDIKGVLIKLYGNKEIKF